jgi:hypothetical protein
MTQDTPAPDGFAVRSWMHHLGGFIARHPRLWIRLGNLETRTVADAIADIPVEKPIYIAGLARSGSTILLETLAMHPWVGTHRYRDFPPIFTPYWWNRWLQRLPRRDEVPTERTHKDGIAVTSESPEAFEEVLWMAFFPGVHDSAKGAVLDRATAPAGFERFYRDHIRKLLAIRGRRRYLAKGNYNVTRLALLGRMLPDARFLIPVRNPAWHIASLMKQQKLFTAGQRNNRRAVQHLQRAGHFEFGLDRRPINTGDTARVAEVIELWRRGEEVRGWARYWAMVHAYLADLLERDADVAARAKVVRYETLCGAPARVINEVLGHCGLPADDAVLTHAAHHIRYPGYYQPHFTAAELAVIAEETGAVAARFGYQPADIESGPGDIRRTATGR